MNRKIERYRKIQIFWSLFIGIGAYFGAAVMFISPDGSLLGMSPMLPYIQKLPLADIFFRNFVWPGIALLMVNGVSNTVSFILLKRRKPSGSISGAVCGILLMLWICIQFVIFDLNPMSTAYFIFGALQAANGFYLRRLEKQKA